VCTAALMRVGTTAPIYVCASAVLCSVASVNSRCFVYLHFCLFIFLHLYRFIPYSVASPDNLFIVYLLFCIFISFYFYTVISLFSYFPVFSILHGFAGLLLSFRISMFLHTFTDSLIQFSCKLRYKKWGIIHAFAYCLRVAPVVSLSCFGRMTGGRKIPSNFAANFKQQFIAMQKLEYISMSEAGKKSIRLT
jgi:hypothetical protein